MSATIRTKHFDSQFDSLRDFTFYEGKPDVYMIASTPRSGSHYLGHLMNSTGLMGDPLEYLQPVHLKRWMETLGTSDMVSTFEELFKRRTSENGVFGLKAHFNQLEQCGGVERVVGDLQIKKIIFVTRLNKVAQAVSYSIAQQTQAWISEDFPLKEAEYDFRNINECLARVLAQEHAWFSYIRRCRPDVMHVSYESLCAHPTRILKDLARYLGLEESADLIEVKEQTEKQAGAKSVEWADRFVSEYYGGGKLTLVGRLYRKGRNFIRLYANRSK